MPLPTESRQDDLDTVPAHRSETRCHTEKTVKTPLRIIGILVIVGCTFFARPASAQPGTFIIVNFGSGLCLEPNGSGLGAPILQQPCDSTRMTQRWEASPATATQYLIVNKGFQTCLDVRNGVNADRTIVQQWSCDIQAHSMRWQLFTLVPDHFFKFISAIGSRCLDVADGSLQPGARIQIYRCTQSNTNTAQIWETRAIPPGSQVSADTSPKGQ
jgi:Ricin-type beta-trefoil lectin domain-like